MTSPTVSGHAHARPMTPRRGDPPGPVAAAFRHATGVVQAINGPVGSGKTTTLFEKFCLYVPLQSPVSPIDGIRRRTITVVHQDYRKLWRGPIPTWWRLVPKNFPASTWNGGRNNPAEHVVRFRHPNDGGPVHVTVNFIAFGDDEPEDVMRGYETSDWLLMEGDLLSYEVFKYATTRLARAPGREHGLVPNPAIGIDFNAPQFGSWVHSAMVDDWPKTPGRLFVQPPAAFEIPGTRGQFNINPNAENLHNLDPGYYQRQIEELRDEDIDLVRRFVCNQPGYSKTGLAVYRQEYDDHRHVSGVTLEPDTRLPLYIGIDAGGDPCAVLIQVRPGGAVWVLEELIAEHGTGPDRFGRELSDLLASPRWSGFERHQILAFPDPSAFWGGDGEADKLHDRDWVTRFRASAEIECRTPATSNALFPRLQSVRDQLIRPGLEPGLLLDPVGCPTIRKGFMQGYQYGKVKRANHGGTHIPATPVKNEFSHPHDSLQYGIMGALKYPQADSGHGRVRRQRRAHTDAAPAPGEHPAGRQARAVRA